VRRRATGSALRVDEDTFWRRDGSPLPVAYSVYPMVIGGQTAGAVLTFTDITGRRQAQAERERLYGELQAASERMRDIFQRAPALMCVMTGPATWSTWPTSASSNWPAAVPLAGLALRAAMPELEGQDFVELIDRVYRSGEACEAAMRACCCAPPRRAPGWTSTSWTSSACRCASRTAPCPACCCTAST
jgi:hypothetical protein